MIHGPGLKERSTIVVSILIYLLIDLWKLLERSDCLRLHVWTECSRRVYFMKLWQGYINVHKKAEEKGETRFETRTTERKKEKNCKLGIFGRTSDFNIFIDGT